jgi:SAM-dependent methyltransferase
VRHRGLGLRWTLVALLESSGRRFTRLRRAVRRLASRLPPPRDEALLALLRSARALILGISIEPTRTKVSRPTKIAAVPSTEAEPRRRQRNTPPFGLPVGPQLPPVDPLPTDIDWLEPPPVDNVGRVIRSIYDTGHAADRYDVELLERLNEEYADRPIVPKPRSYQPGAMAESAKRRVQWAHRYIDLRNKTVLEIGCGNGFEVWMLGNNLGCNAYGVDVRQLGPWETLAGERVHFACADLTCENPYELNTFDRVISYTVWEHVLHPYALLRETYNVLKPGGLAWIRANLYAGPKASHRYRELHFPWPHLLFSDDVIREWDARSGRNPRGASWVNRLSWNHYERYIADIGFILRHVAFQETDWDEEFYRRFEDVLGRFPRTDLKRDFFLAVLEKPS